MPINIQVRGLDEVKYILEGYQGTRMVGIVTEAATFAIVGFMREQPEETPNGSSPPYHSRAEAYGMTSKWDGKYKRGGKTFEMLPVPGYFSARQFLYVMSRIRSGEIKIPYSRTGTVSGAWQAEGKLSRAKAVNQNSAAPYVFGTKTQSRHEALIPWETVETRLDNKSNQVLDAAYLALEKERERRSK